MWRPIKSAPKDGTIIVIIEPVEAHPGWAIELAVWSPKRDGEPRGYWVAPEDDNWNYDNPKFWMPLPELPKRSGREKTRASVVDYRSLGV